VQKVEKREEGKGWAMKRLELAGWLTASLAATAGESWVLLLMVNWKLAGMRVSHHHQRQGMDRPLGWGQGLADLHGNWRCWLMEGGEIGFWRPTISNGENGEMADGMQKQNSKYSGNWQREGGAASWANATKGTWIKRANEWESNDKTKRVSADWQCWLMINLANNGRSVVAFTECKYQLFNKSAILALLLAMCA
jgi:hypothetical protein